MICLHPYISELNDRERRREMIARADQQRLVRQVRDLTRTSRRASRGMRGLGRAWGTAAAAIRLLPRYRAAR
jgi:hypothetical protein